ncbi:MAG: hypothetical protein MH204_00275 [Fimbriimonadaceae bacterium]|nr:hypothetical protein [Fimbriimonadaceae bacterium]
MPRSPGSRKLPVVDYDNHPAYGKVLDKPTFGMRLKAIKALLPWIGVVWFKKAARFDRIPALPGYKGHIKGGFAGRFLMLRRYIPYIVKAYTDDIAGFFKGSKRFEIDPQFKKQAEEFVDTGFLVSNLDEDELTRLKELVAEPIAELRKARAEAGEQTFIGNTKFFNPGDHKELFETLAKYMRRHGMLDAASALIGRPVTVTHLLIQINDPKDAYFHNVFADVEGMADPATNYMHVDTSYDMVKAVVYLNEVGRDNGAFSYVLGSHHARPVGWEGILRRAVDRSGMSYTKRNWRQLFYSLPKGLRKKCTFGVDLEDGSEASNAMLNREFYITSDQGNMGLFANNGVHRGGITKTGERVVFFATIG